MCSVCLAVLDGQAQLQCAETGWDTRIFHFTTFVLDVLSFSNMFLKVELKSKSANVKLILSTSFQKESDEKPMHIKHKSVFCSFTPYWVEKTALLLVFGLKHSKHIKHTQNMRWENAHWEKSVITRIGKRVHCARGAKWVGPMAK